MLSMKTSRAPLSRVAIRCMSGSAEEIAMLEKLLKEAKGRKEPRAAAEPAALGPKFNIGTYNAISGEGLKKFPSNKYNIVPMQGPDRDLKEDIHAVLLRSFKMGSDDVPETVRAVARCGSGTNNIDVAAMSERGIPVFNTPGANANAVKELAVCGLLLASRGIVPGIQHVHTIVKEENKDWAKIKKRVESDKKKFVGNELAGKKLGVIGLGHIGASVAQTAIALGMEVSGYDPAISLEAAWRLPGDILSRAESLQQICEESDYLTLHVPYMKQTHHIIDAGLLKSMKPNCNIINFARGELVDSSAMRALYDAGSRTGTYVADFADEFLHDHPRVILMPHLGASTAEAEENAASMAAMEIIDFIQTGTIQNSVNFPTTKLDHIRDSTRICIVNKNVPGMLGMITSDLGKSGLNILQQINTSRDGIAYNVVDIAGDVEDSKLVEIQQRIADIEGVISSRAISLHGRPGNFITTK